jgi:hypothetical protein
MALVLAALFFCRGKGRPAAPRASFERYRIEDSLALDADSNGIDGQLRLLLDKSLPSAIRDFSPNEDTAHHVPALLTIVDTAGRVLLVDTLARPAAWLDSEVVLQPDPRWKAITIDYSTGLGSYNGPVTSFLRVRGGKLEWLEAREGATGRKIELLKSLKTDWRINRGAHECIHVIACRPVSEHDGEVEFVVIYWRYFRVDDHWERVERREKGVWELAYPETFPVDSCFDF